MKKVIKYAALLMIGGSLILNSCGSKKDDPTPDPTPTPNTPTNTPPDVLVDASTNAGIAESKGKGFTFNVNKADGTKNLKFEIKAKSNISKMYILKSQENGNSVPVTAINTITTENGKSLTSNNAGYTYEFPGGIPAFVATFPFNIRNDANAVSDVYTIWFTSGNGDFANTGKKTIVGPFTVTLKYTAAATNLISATGIIVGSQQASEPSYVTTSGTIGTLFGAKLGEDLSGEEKVMALNSVDFNFVTLNAAGNALGSDAFLISVNQRSGVGFTGNTEGTAATTFSTYTGDFSSATAATLAAITASTTTRIAVSAGNTYSYVTQDGRKGLVKVNSITAGTGGGSKANIDVKVAASK